MGKYCDNPFGVDLTLPHDWSVWSVNRGGQLKYWQLPQVPKKSILVVSKVSKCKSKLMSSVRTSKLRQQGLMNGISLTPFHRSGAGDSQDRYNQYHHYLLFLREWKSLVRNQEYIQCEQLCLEHIERINNDIEFYKQQNITFKELRSDRSKVRNLYAVLLHDHLKQHDKALHEYEECIKDDPTNPSAHFNCAKLYKNHYQFGLLLC